MTEICRYDKSKTYISHHSVRMWTCDDCGDSGMTIRALQCPQCQHLRCRNCEIYSSKGMEDCISVWSENRESQSLKINSAPNLLSPQKDHATPLSSNSLVSLRPKIDLQGFESMAVDEEMAPLPSAGTPDLIMAWDIGASSSYSTPASEVVHTPTSTQESCISSRSFSHQDYVDSETEFETDDSESTDGTTEDEDTMGASNYAIKILDYHLFSILGCDPELAARLIPETYAQLQLGYGTETGSYTASPSSGSRQVPETHGDSNASTFTPSNESDQTGSSRGKRGRERDESKDRGDKSDPKRRRRFRDRSPVPRPRFACHFHKKDPARYCPLNDPKFNTCVGRGNPQLRRMKEHYQKYHRPSQCERCYNIFNDRDELKDHHQAKSPCQKQPDILKEGIDDSQWAKIEPLFHVRRKLSPSQKEQDDFGKWFEIWDILFPDLSRPPNPWVNIMAMSSNAFIEDAEGLLTIFNSTIELFIERGVLQRNDEVHQHYERAFRLALQTRASAAVPAASLDNFFLGSNEPRNEDAEIPPERQTTVEALGNPWDQLVSSQTTPQHLVVLNQDHMTLRFATRSAPSSQEPCDVSGDTCISQPLHGCVARPPEVLTPSAIVEPITKFSDMTNIENQLTVSSSSSTQSDLISACQKPIEYPAEPNTEQSQDILELMDDPRNAYGEPFFDSWQDYVMPFDTNNTDFDEEQLDSDSLANMLELENDDPTAFLSWENSNDKSLGRLSRFTPP